MCLVVDPDIPAVLAMLNAKRPECIPTQSVGTRSVGNVRRGRNSTKSLSHVRCAKSATGWGNEHDLRPILPTLHHYAIARKMGHAQVLGALESLGKQLGGDGLAFWEEQARDVGM